MHTPTHDHTPPTHQHPPPPHEHPPPPYQDDLFRQPLQPEQEDDDDDDDDDDDQHHQGGGQMSLDALLTTQGRSEFLKTLSPNEGDGLWFDRDEPVLVSKISKILQDKFDGPYYSWSVTPSHIQDRFFIQLAHRYTWDPVITPLVREHFDEIAQRRLKGMINYVRTHRRRPNWIRKTLWDKMEAYWNTEDAKARSATASTSRNSPRDGLGPHRHVGGPKSHAQIRREMVKEKGRPVSIGEVFVKTHTRKDGSYVDGKSKKVGETYEQRLQATLSEIENDVSLTSDGASQAPGLTPQQMDAIFLASTLEDDRGNPYGLGRLSREFRKGKNATTVGSSSSKIVALEEKLNEVKQQIEEQASQNKLQMAVLLKYLKEKDPDLPAWVESQAAAAPPTIGEPNGQDPVGTSPTPSSSHTST